ncbi:MAG: aminopeptidase [Wenzhouxiangellaceae bacterium]|nr:aminopeptidase [Wenzhouxiangellaceae bacterium]
MELLAGRESIDQALADPALDADLRTRLETVRGARRFSIDELALPDSGSYTRWVKLGREAVLWNVVAAPEFSLAPNTWCYPLAGCLAYRGWFRREAAEREAARLAAQGLDVRVYPVIAYSTLGWFDDPVTSPMLALPDWQLAGVIIHELAHQRLFVAGDTAFSEAYASAVERAGLARWLDRYGGSGDAAAWQRAQSSRIARQRWLMALRDELSALYAKPLSAAELRARKQACVDGLSRAAAEHEASPWSGRPPTGINNADLALAAVYEDGVAAFADLLAEYRFDFERFHAAVERLAGQGSEHRAAFLAQAQLPAAPASGPPGFCPPSAAEPRTSRP